jgi:hypothetical protein
MNPQLKRQYHELELRSDDGMGELRSEVHKITRNHITHEERGAALRALMTAPRPKATVSASSASKELRLQEHPVVAPRLQALPVELTESIALHLDPTSFGTFRLSCRALRYKSSHCFVKKFFTRRILRLNWVSMRRLSIIQNSECFNAAIKELVIRVEDEGRFCKPTNHVRIASQNRLYHSMNGNRVIDRARYDSSQGQQIEMMLDRIMYRLPVLKSLRFVSEQSNNSKHRNSMSNHAISMVLAAIASRGTKIHTLYMGGSEAKEFICRDYHGHHALQKVLSRDAAALKRAFETLKHLDISWSSTYREARQETQSTVDDFPNSLLKVTPYLETLTLRDPGHVWRGFEPYSQIAYLDHFLVSLTKLKSVELEVPGLCAGGKSLAVMKRFGEKCCGQVEQVILRGLTGVSKQQANVVAQRMRDELGVVNVEIHLAVQGHENLNDDYV